MYSSKLYIDVHSALIQSNSRRNFSHMLSCAIYFLIILLLFICMCLYDEFFLHNQSRGWSSKRKLIKLDPGNTLQYISKIHGHIAKIETSRANLQQL